MKPGKKMRMLCLMTAVCLWLFARTSLAEEETLVIVIDPGHGGKNLGAQYDGFVEKEMTMAAARAMKEELETYENVVVYLTHETDTDMSIKARARFADEKNANFLFCLHFNSSEDHIFYGAEVWVPAYGELYAAGRAFAEIEMQELTEMGLYSRGIKTRLNDRDENYYGILRYCSEFGIPSALIEHCHLDHDRDKVFYQDGEAQWEDFGRADAKAVARYLGLVSAEKGVDYSDYPHITVEVNEEAVRPDKSIPDVCQIELQNLDEAQGRAFIRIRAKDFDSYIQYYSYSLDGGQTFSDLEIWPRPVWNQSEPELIFEVDIPFETEISLCVNAYNGFDVFAQSNSIKIDAISVPEPEPPVYEEVHPKTLYESAVSKQGTSDKKYLILLIAFLGFLMAVIFCIMLRMILRLRRSSRRRRRR